MFFLVVTLPSTASSQVQPQKPSARGEVVDYMVATVNGKLITYSDLLWQLSLQPTTPIERPRLEDLRRALNLVIDQRLIHQEAEKMPHLHADDKEVEPALADLIRLFPSQAEFQQRIKRVGLTAEQLREIVRARIDVEKYLNFRFRNFVVVNAKEIEGYYNDVYVPRFRERTPGRVIPTLEQARSEIEQTLTESKVESDMQQFLDAARDRAEIVILTPL